MSINTGQKIEKGLLGINSLLEKSIFNLKILQHTTFYTKILKLLKVILAHLQKNQFWLNTLSVTSGGGCF